MNHELDKAHTKQNGLKGHEFPNKLRFEVTPKTREAKREKFLTFLKNRYGYTNEKAVDELDRILSQFHIVNRSFNKHRARMNLKAPRVE